jgi:hypothetical protein
VGTVKRPIIGIAEIVSRYREGGEGVGMLSLRAKVPTYRIQEILRDAGVRLRGPNEALRLALDQRAARARRVA